MEKVTEFMINNDKAIEKLFNMASIQTGIQEVAAIITKESLLWQEPKMSLGVAEYSSCIKNYKNYKDLNILDLDKITDNKVAKNAWEVALLNFKDTHDYFEIVNINERLDSWYRKSVSKTYEDMVQNTIELFEDYISEIKAEVEYLQDLQLCLEQNPLICIYRGNLNCEDFIQDKSEDFKYYKNTIKYFVDFVSKVVYRIEDDGYSVGANYI